MKNSILIITLLLPFTLFANEEKATAMDIPSQLVKKANYPNFDDDLNLAGMSQAIERQLEAFGRAGLRGTIKLGGTKYALSILKKTLENFDSDLKETINCFEVDSRINCMKNLNSKIQKSYKVYVPVVKGSKDQRALFTSYYSPTLKVTRKPVGKSKYGIYSKPEDPTLRSKTRNEILFDNALEAKHPAQFFSNDPFEIYLFQVEGGGRVEWNEGTTLHGRYLSYQGTNGKSFAFISKYMTESGYISTRTVAAQRSFLEGNPDKWREIYDVCPNYVYFKVTETEPEGMESIPLSDNRSMAQDRKFYSRKGLLGFVEAKRPFKDPQGQIQNKAFSRFFIDQDTGGAIKGVARADLYFGFGEEAKMTADLLKQRGNMFFLISE